MPTICFLDASVMADWLILNLALNAKKTSREKLELKKKRLEDNPELVYSFELLTSTRLWQPEEFIFLTSSLAISEVISVIHDKFCIDILYEQGIPLKYWYKQRQDFILPKEEIQTLIKEILFFYKTFIGETIFLAENQNLSNTLEIITLHKETNDSFLISQAIQSKAAYFITKDNRLKEHLKNYKKIKICKPKYFFQQILHKGENKSLLGFDSKKQQSL